MYCHAWHCSHLHSTLVCLAEERCSDWCSYVCHDGWGQVGAGTVQLWYLPVLTFGVASAGCLHIHVSHVYILRVLKRLLNSVRCDIVMAWHEHSQRVYCCHTLPGHSCNVVQFDDAFPSCLCAARMHTFTPCKPRPGLTWCEGVHAS